MALSGGARLGPYEILERLGAGGMGEVYKARDLELGRTVAVKVLADGRSAEAGQLRRFEQEARAASALNHPNIVTIHEIGRHESLPYIVMEYVEGETLRSLLSGGALAPDRLLRYATQLAEGLARAHRAGIVHRDLKPENVVISEDDYVKILDFGLAKLMSEPDPGSAVETRSRATKPGTLLGTVGYMSPEQAKGQPADFRSDQFALGAVLYEMASGAPAFRAETSVETLSAILRDEPPPLPPGVPERIRAIVPRCLAKSAAERYESTEAIVAALRETVQELRPSAPSATKEIRSIAVLPLSDLNPRQGEEYFVDGMTEALITHLTKVGAIKVISRTSSMRYRQSEKPLTEIARELRVDGIVEGSVLRAEERVRISVQLVDARSDQSLWAESYEREARDVLALQSEVARAIVQEIRVKVSPSEQAVLEAPRPRVDPSVYSLYLRGRQLNKRFDEKSLAEARRLFERVIEKDPSFAGAHAGLADSYYFLTLSTSLAPAEFYPRAKSAALAALELDETLAEAHTALGNVRALFDWDWSAAEASFRRAIELNPSSAAARWYYSIPLLNLGRYEDCLRECDRCIELDPLSPGPRQTKAYCLYVAGRLEESAAQHQLAIDLDADYVLSWYSAGFVYLRQGHRRRACESFERAVALSGGVPLYRSGLGVSYARTGREGEALTILRELEELSREAYVGPVGMAWLYASLGETDRALEQIERGYESRDSLLVAIPSFDWFDPLRDEPRFQGVVRRMNFPEPKRGLGR